MTKTLLELLDEREKHFQSLTDQLIDMITPNVAIAVIERLTQQRKFGDGQKITWQQVVHVPSVNMLIVLAVLELPPGFKTKLASGEEFEVTEENAGYFSYPIRIGVPMDLAQSGTKEQVHEYLEKQEREMEEATEAALHRLEKELEQAKEPEEFDISVLSDEQKRLFINIPPGSKPN